MVHGPASTRRTQQRASTRRLYGTLRGSRAPRDGLRRATRRAPALSGSGAAPPRRSRRCRDGAAASADVSRHPCAGAARFPRSPSGERHEVGRSARKRSTTPLVLARSDGAGRVDEPPAGRRAARTRPWRQLPRREACRPRPAAGASAPRGYAAATPRPEHGRVDEHAIASRRARPRRAARPGAARAPSTLVSPARRARRRSSSSFLPVDVEREQAAPACPAAPPAPASCRPRRRRRRPPCPRGGGATASATSWLPSSMHLEQPLLERRRPNTLTRVSKQQPGRASAVGREVACPRRRAARPAPRASIFARVDPDRHAARAGSSPRASGQRLGSPRSATKRSMSQVGYEQRAAPRDRDRARSPSPASSRTTRSAAACARRTRGVGAGSAAPCRSS